MAKDNQKQPDPEPQEQMVVLTKDALIELLREARRNPAEEARIEAEAARINQRRKQMVQLASQEMKARETAQARCAHRKPNGEECSGGQEYSDGRVRIICLRCQKTLREYWAPGVAQGMALAAKMEELGISEEELQRRMQGHDVRSADIGLMPGGVQFESLTTDN